MRRAASVLTALKLGKRPTLCGGAVSMGNCRKGFMSRCGWSTVGVLRNVGTAPARLMLPVGTRGDMGLGQVPYSAPTQQEDIGLTQRVYNTPTQQET